MKKFVIQLVIIGLLLFVTNVTSAFNPMDLMILPPPPPNDNVTITVDLGDITCEALGCSWTIYVYEVVNGTDVSLGTITYIQQDPITGGPYSVNPSATRLCVRWHCTDSSCHPLLPDKTCCISYTGGCGTCNINIPCNPCF